MLILGADNAGKTTLLGRMSGEKKFENIQPTQGFNVKKVSDTANNIDLHVWDIGGKLKMKDFITCFAISQH